MSRHATNLEYERLALTEPMGYLPAPAPPVALPMLAELLAPHENERGFFSSSFLPFLSFLEAIFPAIMVSFPRQRV
jgi:hypothetical protein